MVLIDSSVTPAKLGYRMPAEWEAHEATWLSWPHREGISFPDKYHTIPANLAAIMRQIVPREEVHINVPNGNWEYIVRQQLKENRCRGRDCELPERRCRSILGLGLVPSPVVSRKQR